METNGELTVLYVKGNKTVTKFSRMDKCYVVYNNTKRSPKTWSLKKKGKN